MTSPVPTRKSKGSADADTGPVRTCVGCRRRAAVAELVRLVHVDGAVVVSRHGAGRGAWICDDRACVERAARTKAFSRAFRSKLADAELGDTLHGWLGVTAP